MLAAGCLLIIATASGISAQEDSTPQQATPPPAQIAVSPGKFEIDLDSGPGVHALRLMNFSQRTVSVRVTVVPWDLDERNRVRVLEPTEQSLDQWMVFNPGTFAMEPGGVQTVRFAIRPRVRPDDGEHRAMIYFNEVPDPARQGAVQVVFKLGVAVYGYAGDVVREGVLHGVRAGGDASTLRVGFDLSSLGNAHVRMRGQLAVWPAAAFPGKASISRVEGMSRPDFVPPEPVLLLSPLPNTPVLGGTRREVFFAQSHSLPPGRYVVAALGTLGDQEVRGSAEFVVPAAPAGRVGGQ